MNYEAIKTFIVLAETRNFTRTAELLYISQPTVTARIRTLEEDVGHALFERTNKRVELTTAGKFFLPYASNLYRETNECAALMQNYKHPNSVSISAPGTCWDFGPLRESVIDYCNDHPEQNIQLMHNISRDALIKLTNNEIDIAVSYILPNAPDLEYVLYTEEDLLLVASGKTDPALLKNVEAENSGLQFIRPMYADVVSQMAEEGFFRLSSSISVAQPAMYYEVVRRGFGVGLLQRSIAAPALVSGELVEIDCEYNQHPMPYKNYLVFRKEKEEALRNLVDRLLKDAAAFSKEQAR